MRHGPRESSHRGAVASAVARRKVGSQIHLSSLAATLSERASLAQERKRLQLLQQLQRRQRRRRRHTNANANANATAPLVRSRLDPLWLARFAVGYSVARRRRLGDLYLRAAHFSGARRAQSLIGPQERSRRNSHISIIIQMEQRPLASSSSSSTSLARALRPISARASVSCESARTALCAGARAR